jgi:hypothetical protein
MKERGPLFSKFFMTAFESRFFDRVMSACVEHLGAGRSILAVGGSRGGLADF